MAAYTANRTGNWSDISNTGPWYNGVAIAAYPGQTKRTALDLSAGRM